MQKIAKQYRQGDVLLTPATIPYDAVQAEKNRVVLAEGEVTNHCHAIDFTAKQMKTFRRGEELYLRVLQPVALTHQEHAEALIEPGDSLVKRQVEVWMDEVRKVAD